ncbi:MAG: hypothetical protein R3B84_16565 [Zavarzinella sp.]
MNLYGWSLPAFKQVLGSKDSAVLEKATALIFETLPKEPAQSKAMAWLHTLVVHGFPFREDRGQSSEPADGGLLTVQMETEAHAFTVYCLARAIASEDYLDLASESSNWHHSAVVSLYNELSACKFHLSGKCPVEYHTWMWKLSNGSPIFGDDFRTEWSFYTLFSNRDLAAMIPVFKAAADFQRSLPEGYPEEFTKIMAVGLSDAGRELVLDLIKWFGQIQQAGQDAFILWW